MCCQLYVQSFRQIDSKLWKVGPIQNRYPIVVYGVISDSESKNHRPIFFENDDFVDVQALFKGSPSPCLE